MVESRKFEIFRNNRLDGHLMQFRSWNSKNVYWSSFSRLLVVHCLFPRFGVQIAGKSVFFGYISTNSLLSWISLKEILESDLKSVEYVDNFCGYLSTIYNHKTSPKQFFQLHYQYWGRNTKKTSAMVIRPIMGGEALLFAFFVLQKEVERDSTTLVSIHYYSIIFANLFSYYSQRKVKHMQNIRFTWFIYSGFLR